MLSLVVALATLACFVPVAALNKEYPGYYHFSNLAMDHYSNNVYVTPGDGAHDLGYRRSLTDLDLAKHLCDRYDSCLWFDGQGLGPSSELIYPGGIGWWTTDSTQDIYIKNTSGTVVAGSTYFNTKYLNVHDHRNVLCYKVAGPWALPPDDIKKQCDQLLTCDGFTVKNDLSTGFLCQFETPSVGRAFGSYIKLPPNSSTEPTMGDRVVV